MFNRPVRGLRPVLVVAMTCALLAAIVATPATAQTTTTAAPTAEPTEVSTKGVGTPPAGSGLGTKAALENPTCNPDAVKGYGVFPFVTTNGGPYCVAPAPKNNGGTTARGVTATSIKVVVIVATAAQLAAQASAGSSSAKNEATGATGTMRDAILDNWAPYAQFYEQWGRTVEFVFVDSSGSDEAAQRADALKVNQEKPFAVIDSTPDGLTVLQTALAQDKYVVFGYGSSVADTIKQAPYRWGQTDQQSGALNTAEWAGKQLVKKKAEYAGDEAITGETRAFGAVYDDKSVDIKSFASEFGKYGGKLALAGLEYETTSGILGDPTTAQAQAPSIIAKLKDAGVTSVFLFTNLAMNAAMTAAATSQEYYPEWLLTGFQFADLTLLSRNNDQTQWAHAFGLSNLFPLVKDAPPTVGALNWYWGTGVATSSSLGSAMDAWLATGIHYAGPTLTAQNFQKGYFAAPARGGYASDSPVSFMAGRGKTPNLPYNEFMSLGIDFAPIWYDANTTGDSQVRVSIAKGVTMYVDGAKRYIAGTWPTKPFKFFDPAGAVFVFPTSPVPVSPDIPCTGCPSAGGVGAPAATRA